MNTIKKIISLSFAVLLTLNIATAQRSGKTVAPKNPETIAQKQTERMTEQLSLTNAQQEKVARINLASAQKMKAAKASGKDHEAFKAIRSEKKAAIKAVLTTDQLAKYKAMKSQKGSRGGNSLGHNDGKRPAKGPNRIEGANRGKKGEDRALHSNKDPETRAAERTARLTEKLGLSNAQATKITEINLAYGEKRHALKNSTDKEAAKAAMKALRKEQTTAIKAILTPTQVTMLEEMKNSREGKGRGRGSKGA